MFSSRKHLEMEKSTIASKFFLENQRFPLERYGLGFQKGESIFHEGKKNNEELKRPIANNSNNKSSNNQGNKQ